jgi:PAS domain S-box-containing protein
VGRPVRTDLFRDGARVATIGIAPVAVALVLSLGLQHLFPYPFLFLFLGAVMVASWVGGMLPGLVSVLASTLCVLYFFVPPFRSFTVSPTAETYLVGFVICIVLASWASSAKRRREDALRQARDELEERVAERTAEIQTSNAELREREHQLRLLTEVIPQQIWSSAPDGAIDYCNRRLLEYVGCSLDEMRGDGFLETIHPDDRDRFREAWREALVNGMPFEGEWRVRGSHGQHRSFVTRALPLRRADGNVVRWYGTNTDIEDHRQAEQALLRTQGDLAYLSRVLTMGELTTSIAHEMNQPLTAVVTHGYACLGWLAATPPNLASARETAERIIEDGRRAGAILGRIRALFRKEPAIRAPLDMNEVIHELTRFLRDEAHRRGVSIHADLAADLPAVYGDRVQLQQVVLNLVMNGIDAIDAPGLARDLHIASRRDGAEIQIRVEDSGAGIDPDIAARIFDPFFTTKPQGLGMGLSISRSIVEAHEGRLWSTARAGQGACFQFTLPVEESRSG